MIIHENWVKAGLLEKLKARAAKRSLADLTISPVLSWTTPMIMAHVNVSR